MDAYNLAQLRVYEVGAERMKTRFFLERNSATIRRAVRSKTILASGQPVKLYSLDGKTWFSKAKIYAEFKRRRAGEKRLFKNGFAVQRWSATWDPLGSFFLRINSIASNVAARRP